MNVSSADMGAARPATVELLRIACSMLRMHFMFSTRSDKALKRSFAGINRRVEIRTGFVA